MQLELENRELRERGEKATTTGYVKNPPQDPYLLPPLPHAAPPRLSNVVLLTSNTER